jgi:hypothetical protein
VAARPLPADASSEARTSESSSAGVLAPIAKAQVDLRGADQGDAAADGEGQDWSMWAGKRGGKGDPRTSQEGSAPAGGNADPSPAAGQVSQFDAGQRGEAAEPAAPVVSKPALRGGGLQVAGSGPTGASHNADGPPSSSSSFRLSSGMGQDENAGAAPSSPSGSLGYPLPAKDQPPSSGTSSFTGVQGDEHRSDAGSAEYSYSSRKESSAAVSDSDDSAGGYSG